MKEERLTHVIATNDPGIVLIGALRAAIDETLRVLGDTPRPGESVEPPSFRAAVALANAFEARYTFHLPKKIADRMNDPELDVTHASVLSALSACRKAGLDHVNTARFGVAIAANLIRSIADNTFDSDSQQFFELEDEEWLSLDTVIARLVEFKCIAQELLDSEVERVLRDQHPSLVGQRFDVLTQELTSPLIIVTIGAPASLVTGADIRKQSPDFLVPLLRDNMDLLMGRVLETFPRVGGVTSL